MPRIEKPFKVLICENDRAYSRNRAVGISYLNRFLIEEDTQFECAAVVERKLGSSPENLLQDLESHFNQFSNKSDFICHLVLSCDFNRVEFRSFDGESHFHCQFLTVKNVHM